MIVGVDFENGWFTVDCKYTEIIQRIYELAYMPMLYAKYTMTEISDFFIRLYISQLLFSLMHYESSRYLQQ